MLAGDLSLPKIDWKSVNTNTEAEGKELYFIEKIRDIFLMQHIAEPTRCSDRDNASNINLFLTEE